MSKVLVNESSLTGIANAIRSKNGTTDTYKPSEMAGAIEAIQTGGTVWNEPPIKDICFWDYDGTLLYSYTLKEAKTLTLLPTPPSHEGLVFQNWNWSLDDIKQLDRPCDIGALYTTDTNNTRIYIEVDNYKTITLRPAPLVSGKNITITWGDGNWETVSWTWGDTVETSHTYEKSGKYIIELSCDDGYSLGDQSHQFLSPNNNLQTCNVVYKIECGTNVRGNNFSMLKRVETISINEGNYSYNFSDCYRLKGIVLHGGLNTLRENAFDGCTSIKVICMCKEGTISSSHSFAYNCSALNRLSFPQNSVTTMYYDACNTCESISYIDIPESCTTIYNRAFESCGYINKLVIRAGDSMTINSPFNYSSHVIEYYFTANTPPVLASSDSLKVDGYTQAIYVPAGRGEAYKTATNWTTYADKIVEMET